MSPSLDAAAANSWIAIDQNNARSELPYQQFVIELYGARKLLRPSSMAIGLATGRRHRSWCG